MLHKGTTPRRANPANKPQTNSHRTCAHARTPSVQVAGTLVAQSGCVLQALDDEAAKHGFLMPLDLGEGWALGRLGACTCGRW